MVLLIPLTCIKLSSTVILVHFLKNVYKNTANLFFLISGINHPYGLDSSGKHSYSPFS